MLRRSLLVFLGLLLFAEVAAAQSSADVHVSGSLAPDKLKKGSITRATVVMDIPSGLHVQSHRPLDKFLIGTKLDVETRTGMNVGAISYPRALVKQLKFSKKPVAVYEGRVMIRFNVTVPANYSGGSGEIKGKLLFQACNDESCFPPVTREVKMWLNIE
jgi:thiol:disulfide interchange protein DsbD